MLLESFNIPIPSELVMTFSGFLSYSHTLNIYLVILVGTLGNVLGSVLSYYLGYYGGYPFLEKYGKYIFISDKDIVRAHKWFERDGEAAVFFTRVLPVFRTFISLPAGIAKMDIKKFILYTTLGTLIWDIVLSFLGYYFASNWQKIYKVIDNISIYFFIAFLLILAIYFYKKYREKRKSAQKFIK
jgi:membrane protein DedA with SNARE-associated domain